MKTQRETKIVDKILLGDVCLWLRQENHMAYIDRTYSQHQKFSDRTYMLKKINRDSDINEFDPNWDTIAIHYKIY